MYRNYRRRNSTKDTTRHNTTHKKEAHLLFFIIFYFFLIFFIKLVVFNVNLFESWARDLGRHLTVGIRPSKVQISVSGQMKVNVENKNLTIIVFGIRFQYRWISAEPFI
jgi:hypothetical protein